MHFKKKKKFLRELNIGCTSGTPLTLKQPVVRNLTAILTLAVPPSCGYQTTPSFFFGIWMHTMIIIDYYEQIINQLNNVLAKRWTFLYC